MANNIDLDAAMAELDVPSSPKPAIVTSRSQPRARGDTSKTAVKPKKEPEDEVIPNLVPSFSLNPNPKIEPDIKPKIEAHAEDEDEVAEEIDIFFNPFPLGKNEAELYVMEYPLRPRWRPYETEKRCTEMRMMPKCKHMEVDLRMDGDPETFDSDMAMSSGKYKQTLRSQKNEPPAEHYAVGIFRNNQLHLNPLDGTMQLRPVIRSNNQKRKSTAQEVDPKASSSTKKAKKKLGKSAQSEDEDEDEAMAETRASTTEPWNSKTQPMDSMTEPWDSTTRDSTTGPWDLTMEPPWDPTMEPAWDSAQTEDKNEAKTKPGDPAQSEDEDEAKEPWVPLKFLPEGNIYSYEYQKKMVKTVHKKILEFITAQAAYMRVLCPNSKVPVSHRETKEAIIREVRRLPLEERLKKYFTEVSHLNRFDFIEYFLAPDDPVEEVLEQVQMLADLVHGVWVTKSSLLCEGDLATVRDYILLQFTKANSIPRDRLRANLGRDVLQNGSLRPLLGNLITSTEENIKFKGPHTSPRIPDLEFRKRYKKVVKGQMEAWSGREESIMERVRELNKNGVSQFKRVVVLKEDKEKKLPENSSKHGDGEPAIPASKSLYKPLIRDHLQEALTKIFDEQKVRTIGSVVRGLGDFAKKLSALPKRSDKNEYLMKGALCGIDVAQPDLQKVVTRVAVHLHGVYVMKPPKKDHLRNVFIKLFMEAKPKAVIRKQEIMQLAKKLFKRKISESEYVEVVDDICLTTEDGGLMLKHSD